MKPAEEIEPDIRKLYSELNKDPKELIRFWERDYMYYIQRSDSAVTQISRDVIDDYYGSEPGVKKAEMKINEALKNFKIRK